MTAKFEAGAGWNVIYTAILTIFVAVRNTDWHACARPLILHDLILLGSLLEDVRFLARNKVLLSYRGLIRRTSSCAGYRV